MSVPDLRVAPADRAVAETVIAVHGLRVDYGRKQVLRGLDLEVRRGEVVGILGPNGAGKTTTVEVLEALRPRSGGEVMVLGTDPARADRRWRGRVGVVLQESEAERELTVRECLRLYAGYHEHPEDVDATLALVGLSDRADRRCRTLSGGELRRLDVGLALIGGPELIFLDEPTTGFDPAARRGAWGVIEGLSDAGKTIVLTTHYMEEAEALADWIVLLVDGQVAAEGSPQQLRARGDQRSRIGFDLPPGVAPGELPEDVADAIEDVHGDRVTLRTAAPLALLASLAAWADVHGEEPANLAVSKPSLEDVYLQLTGNVA